MGGVTSKYDVTRVPMGFEAAKIIFCNEYYDTLRSAALLLIDGEPANKELKKLSFLTAINYAQKTFGGAGNWFECESFLAGEDDDNKALLKNIAIYAIELDENIKKKAETDILNRLVKNVNDFFIKHARAAVNNKIDEIDREEFHCSRTINDYFRL